MRTGEKRERMNARHRGGNGELPASTGIPFTPMDGEERGDIRIQKIEKDEKDDEEEDDDNDDEDEDDDEEKDNEQI